MLVMTCSFQCHGGTTIDSLHKELLKSFPDSIRIETLNNLYKAYMVADMRDEAYQQLNSAFDLATKTKDRKRLAETYLNLGSYNNTIDNYNVALANLLEALRLFREINYAKGEAATLMNIGITYYTIEEYSDALNYYHQAEELYLKNNEPDKADIVKYLNANILLNKGWLNSAMKMFREIISSGKNISDQRRNECLLGIGTVFLRMNVNDSAEAYIYNAYHYFDSIGNKDAKSYSGARLCELYLMQNLPQKAIDSGLINLEIAQHIESRDVQLQLFNTLSEAYHRVGDDGNAYLYQKKYYELKDVLYNEKSLKQYNVLEKKYAEDQHKHELEIIEQQKQKQKIITFSVIGLLVLIIASLIYRFVLKQRVNKKLEVSNLKLEDNNVKLESINLELKHTLGVLKETQEKLIQQEKIASLGKVTAGIAHEIQNPLNFVTNFATINNDLLAELQDNLSDADRKEALVLLKQNNEKIRQHGLRANVIVKDMLMESRDDAMPRELTDINKLIRENFDYAYQAFRAKHAGFICDTKLYIQSLPPIKVEKRQLGRVFLNLFENALYAMKSKADADKEYKPRVIIKTTRQETGIQVMIEDNGKGIPNEIIRDIFNPFYTTKPTGEGTGLGLSICYDIVTKRHHGVLSVVSEINQFTRFTIEIPSLVKQEAI